MTNLFLFCSFVMITCQTKLKSRNVQDLSTCSIDIWFWSNNWKIHQKFNISLNIEIIWFLFKFRSIESHLWKETALTALRKIPSGRLRRLIMSETHPRANFFFRAIKVICVERNVVIGNFPNLSASIGWFGLNICTKSSPPMNLEQHFNGILEANLPGTT